jgi:disulfide bond formation protein DsbB
MAEAHPRLHRNLVLVGLTAITTALVIQHSLHVGRLALPPTYDDISFMLDGARRWQALQTATNDPILGTLARDYVNWPWASFYTTPVSLLAFFAYSVCMIGPLMSFKRPLCSCSWC